MRRRWIIVRMSGVVSLREVLTLIQTARANVEHRMWPMLVDAGSATTDVTEQEVETAATAVQRAVQTGGERGHVALATADDVMYARMLQYETRCAELGVRVIRVFRQKPDAEQWLALVSAVRNFR
jgi:hypothetical protein